MRKNPGSNVQATGMRWTFRPFHRARTVLVAVNLCWAGIAVAQPASPIMFARQPTSEPAMQNGLPNIAALSFFEQPGKPVLGFSANRWWTRLPVPAADAFLRWDDTMAKTLAVFERCGTTPWAGLPRMNARYALYRLRPDSTGCELLLMQESMSLIEFRLQFITEADLAGISDGALVGLTLGASVTVSIMSLVLWISTRRRGLIYFILYQLSACLVILRVWGFMPYGISLGTPWVADLLGVCALQLSAIGYFNYVRDALRLRLSYPGIDRAMDLFVVLCLMPILTQAIGSYTTARLIILSLLLVHAAYWGIVVLQWNRERRLSMQQLFGYAPSIGGVAAFVCHVLGYTPLSNLRSLYLAGQIGSTLALGLWIAQAFKNDRDRREAKLTETVHELRENRIELEKYQVDLETLVAGRTAELQRALSSERAIVAQQRDFTAMIGHEFRTPLAVIDGQARRIGSAAAEGMDMLRRAREIRDAVRDMIGLMDGLLFHARQDAGGTEYRFETLAVRDVLDQAVHAALPRERLQDLRITCENGIACRADRTLLVTAASNLLGNAAKYSSPGSPITVIAAVVPEGVAITIEDRGSGIATSEIEAVFARFQRGSNALTTPGSGLGLFLANQIVEGHGGSIRVTSSLGRGSCFVLHLPMVRPVPMTAAEVA